jgi:glyoxylate reductase
MKIYVTRGIPEVGLKMLRDKGYEVDVNPNDRTMTKKEIVAALAQKPYDGALTLLTDPIDADVFATAPSLKIISNYAVGYNNIDVVAATAKGVVVANSPAAQSETVAEHAVAHIMALTTKLVEADQFVRDGKYQGWDPMIFWGTDLLGKTLGILGAGRIGGRVAHVMSKGIGMNVIYYDVKRNEEIERDCGAQFRATPEEVMREADVISVHVPLLPSTTHLVNAEHFKMMKPTAILINTSRGPVVDEAALVEALRAGTIAGAGLDVYENEPHLAPGLTDLPNVTLTPHTASATQRAREDMAVMAAQNIIDFFETGKTKNQVTQ